MSDDSYQYIPNSQRRNAVVPVGVCCVLFAVFVTNYHIEVDEYDISVALDIFVVSDGVIAGFVLRRSCHRYVVEIALYFPAERHRMVAEVEDLKVVFFYSCHMNQNS